MASINVATVGPSSPCHPHPDARHQARLDLCDVSRAHIEQGISSVVTARLLGVNQKTAWKIGHAIRELMNERNAELLPLEDVVEVDEAYVGGAPEIAVRGL